MYYYIYDEFTQEKRYQKELAAIEVRLSELELNGKVSRLALFRNPEELIRDELKRGITTVVVVGNDSTIFKVLDVVTEFGVTLAIIPLGEKNSIAKMLGVPEGEYACDTLSARITETLDTGFINGKRFLTKAVIDDFSGEIRCGSYVVVPDSHCRLEIRNLIQGETEEEICYPKDGGLDLTLFTKTSSGWGLFGRSKQVRSRLPLDTFTIQAKTTVKMNIDEETLEDSRFTIGVDSATLKVVTGRDRLFF